MLPSTYQSSSLKWYTRNESFRFLIFKAWSLDSNIFCFPNHYRSTTFHLDIAIFWIIRLTSASHFSLTCWSFFSFFFCPVKFRTFVLIYRDLSCVIMIALLRLSDIQLNDLVSHRFLNFLTWNLCFAFLLPILHITYCWHYLTVQKNKLTC